MTATLSNLNFNEIFHKWIKSFSCTSTGFPLAQTKIEIARIREFVLNVSNKKFGGNLSVGKLFLITFPGWKSLQDTMMK